MPCQPHRDRDKLLRSRMRELHGLCRAVRCCSCSWLVVVPTRLVSPIHSSLTLEAWIARLKCRQCGERVGSATVADDPHIDVVVRDDADHWSVEVLP
jgi:hypothetical protein